MATKVQTIYAYYNDNKKYFLNWDSDVDVVKPPLPSDSFNRIFYAENGILKVTDNTILPLTYPQTEATTVDESYALYPCPPAPGPPPIITGTAIGDDPTLIETRGYVYTFVNKYGEEGPPSLVSNLIDIYDGNTVSISGMVEDDPGTKYAVTAKRIYRINQLSGTSAQYQYVAEIPYNIQTYEDSIPDASLGEVLPSAEWDMAPSGIKGLIVLPNQVLVGFVDNYVCFSEPKYPHAWPVRYRKPLDQKIIGLGAFGTTVIAITEGQPYAIVGDHPSIMVPERIDLGLSGSSKRGILNINGVTIYPSPEGLVGIGAKGVDLLTNDLFTKDEWSVYNPSTISAYYWENKYVGFYQTVTKRAGFIFDPKTKDFIDLDRQDPSYPWYYATAGYHDPVGGILYLQFYTSLSLLTGGAIDAFNQGTAFRWMQYKSKRFKTKPWCPGAIRVVVKVYPVLVDVIYPSIPHTIVLSITTDNPVRLPPVGLIDTVEIKTYGKTEITAIYLASTFDEIPL